MGGEVSAGIGLQGIEGIVGAVRVVVEKNEVLDASRDSEFYDLMDTAMPPSVLGGHVIGEVLCVVAEHIGIPAESSKFVERGGLFRGAEFIVRNEYEATALVCQPIAKGPTGVIDRQRVDLQAVCVEIGEPIAFDPVVGAA